METEFKYRLNSESDIDRILDDELLRDSVHDGNVDEIDMHAIYFDTADEDLRKAGVAYRIRYENDRVTATIKWDAHVNTGLHEREEVNLVLNDERFVNAPNIDVFESSEAYPVLLKAAGDKKLIKTVEMKFHRKLIKVNTGASLSAVSFDVGWIKGEVGTVPVCEMEVEWYYGDEDDFKRVAEDLAARYSLEPENVSKLQRGFKQDIYDFMAEAKAGRHQSMNRAAAEAE